MYVLSQFGNGDAAAFQEALSRTIGTDAGEPTSAAELPLLRNILEERRKHFRNEAFGHEIDAEEMSKDAMAQPQEIDEQRAASRTASETSTKVAKWRDDSDQKIGALRLDDTDTRECADQSAWNGGQARSSSKPDANTGQASRGKNNSEVHTSNNLDEMDNEELSSLED